MYYLLIPYAYFLRTRLRSKVQRLSWACVYAGPVILFYLYYGQPAPAALIVMYYAVNLVYENGYVHNDVYTVDRERRPTLRLSRRQIAAIKRNVVGIMVARAVILAALLVILWGLLPTRPFWLFAGLLVCLQVCFALYNTLRNRWNLVLIGPLAYLRFYAPLLPFLIATQQWLVMAGLGLVYPVLKIIEFGKQPRYRLPSLGRHIGQVDTFRVVYYAGLTLAGVGLYLLTGQGGVLLLLSGYYLIYRLLSRILHRRFKPVRQAIDNSRKPEYR